MSTPYQQDLMLLVPPFQELLILCLSYPLLSLFEGNSFSAFNPSEPVNPYTLVHTHAHTGETLLEVHTHWGTQHSGSSGQPQCSTPGTGGGFRCLAQGHLIRGRGRKRGLHSYFPRPHIFQRVGIRTDQPPVTGPTP